MEIINLGNMITNNYLIKIENKLVLIDTGYSGNFDRFVKNLSQHNIAPEDIDYLVLTHAHDDHAGFLEEVITATKATLILHQAAVARLLVGHNQWIGGYSGILAFLFGKVMALFGKGKHEFPQYTVPDNALIWNGQEPFFKLPGLPIKIIALPGHTEDHIGVLAEDKALFCSDAAMNGFPSVKRKIIWIENLEDYKASWNKMIKLGVDWLYPSHGRPFKKDDLEKYKKHLNKLKLIPDFPKKDDRLKDKP